MMTKLEELKLALDRADEVSDKALDEWGKAEAAWGESFDAYEAEQNRLNKED